MKTIEERAKEYDSSMGVVVGECGTIDLEKEYIDIATEQQEIDIQCAYDFCCKVCRDAYGICGYGTPCFSCDRKKELCKTMKGETK